MIAPEIQREVWDALTDAVRRTGHVTQHADHDAAMCIASNALAALQAAGFTVLRDEPDHVLSLLPNIWTLRHSVACRAAGTLETCPQALALAAGGASRLHEEFGEGRWVFTVVDGRPTLTAEVSSSGAGGSGR